MSTPEFPAVTVVVTVTWSLGLGEDGDMLGVLMFGPGGGAATIAMDGSSNSSERTKAKFLAIGDMFFLTNYWGG